jgi:hypothetical protein
MVVESHPGRKVEVHLGVDHSGSLGNSFRFQGASYGALKAHSSVAKTHSGPLESDLRAMKFIPQP